MKLSNLLKIIGIKKKTEQRRIELDPESLKQHHINEALAIENGDLKGRIAKYEAMISAYRQSQKDVNEEENVKKYLTEERQRIISENNEEYLSLFAFFNKVNSNKKFRNELVFTTFNRKSKLGQFGDIGITTKGRLVLVDSKGNLILKGGNPKDLFFEVAGLMNDVSKGMIPLAMDEEGTPIENIMTWEMPELIETGTEGKLRFAKARRRPVYEIIKDLDEKISKLTLDLEESEGLNQKYLQENRFLKSENRLGESLVETTYAEQSYDTRKVTMLDRASKKLQEELLTVRQMNVSLEEGAESDGEIMEELREKAERRSSKLPDEIALEKIQDIRKTFSKEEERKEYLQVLAKEQSQQNAVEKSS